MMWMFILIIELVFIKEPKPYFIFQCFPVISKVNIGFPFDFLK